MAKSRKHAAHADAPAKVTKRRKGRKGGRKAKKGGKKGGRKSKK